MFSTLQQFILLVVPLMQTESPDEQLTDIPYPSLHSFPPPVGKQCQHFKDVTKSTQVYKFVLKCNALNNKFVFVGTCFNFVAH